jgi:acetylornithine deacetylase
VTLDPVEVLRRLVAVPSEQTEALEADPQVRRFIAETVADAAAELGLEARLHGSGALIATVGPASGRALLLLGYAMTHPANRMADAFSAEIVERGGRRALRGRGVAEQKAALAALLSALAGVRGEALAGQAVLVVLPSGETGRHDALAAVIDDLPTASGAVLGLGTEMTACTAHKGRVDVLARVGGRAGHSSMPWAAVNAIDGARVVLERLAAIVPPGEHPVLGRATLTATAIVSRPRSTHTIPDEVELVLDRRLLPGEYPGPAVGALADRLGAVDPCTLELRTGAVTLPAELPAGSELLAGLRSAAERAGLGTLAETHQNGGLDAGYLIDRGVHALAFGPGSPALAHTDDEWVALDDLAQAVAVYRELVHARLDPGVVA